jgi:hypothetical protein
MPSAFFHYLFMPSSIIYLCLLSSAHQFECKWIPKSIPKSWCIWMSCVCEFECLISLCVYIYTWFLFVSVYTLNLDTWMIVYVCFFKWTCMFECLVSIHTFTIFNFIMFDSLNAPLSMSHKLFVYINLFYVCI